ncbi:hypothetical protein PanWU01x14_298420 [Parasponia andersonii]|uniref:Uncharacterized protein n=1 Tax=Parasponia andersonii TaxID=3476 RepID=A0A2P5AUQ2_PARAD|nr:hypothetical protein PanWU01x14_298420 [Parasponia andersonii]
MAFGGIPVLTLNGKGCTTCSPMCRIPPVGSRKGVKRNSCGTMIHLELVADAGELTMMMGILLYVIKSILTWLRGFSGPRPFCKLDAPNFELFYPKRDFFCTYLYLIAFKCTRLNVPKH